MVNIVAGKNVVPELIQSEVNEKNIYKIVSEFLNDEKRYNAIKEELQKIKSILGEPGASKKAASIIYSYIK